ncbi:MAG: DMT family transporter [Betaproteobacteria bacterium]|nr:DMT family transporter [Betaproteobacteria bacterium]
MLRVPSLPVASLLVGASLWGVVWYPYRLLGGAGLDGAWASALTYGVALAVGSAIFLGHWRDVARAPWACLAMGLAIGWSNLAYVIGVLEGEVMRVLLLFYLAPLWTVPLARVLLGERLDARGALVMVVALAGAAVMLWHPETGAPWPSSRAEWLGLVAGFFFALGNVLVRALAQLRDTTKSLAIWAGVTAAALLYLPWAPTAAPAAMAAAAASWPVWVAVGFALLAMSLALQYGLSRVPANRAIVILLFELVVAAAASWWLAGETLRAQDWIGGALVVAASLVSGLEPPRRPPKRVP